MQGNGGLNSDQKGLTEMGWIRTTASKGEKSGGEEAADFEWVRLPEKCWELLTLSCRSGESRNGNDEAE